MKFKVGDKVLHGNFPGKILDACKGYQHNICLVDFSPTFDIPEKWIEEEALKLFPEKQDIGFGSPMPVPGKGAERWIYQLENGGLTQYDAPFQYNPTESVQDIVGEWVDEVVLPSEKIKQYCIVSSQGITRGEIMDTFESRQVAESMLGSDGWIGGGLDCEIVEVTGVLPERKVKCQ